MHFQIDLPALTYQYLTFLQSLWMVPAHHFAHSAPLGINSSHSLHLSPTLLQKEELMKRYEDARWMSLQSLSRGSILPCKTHMNCFPWGYMCMQRYKSLGCSEGQITTEMQNEWHLLDKWRTSSILRKGKKRILKCRKHQHCDMVWAIAIEKKRLSVAYLNRI